MAISLTSLQGTDSVASSRITINDNFTTVLSALNNVLSIIDISTGKINNSVYGTNNDIETEDLIVRGTSVGGISVLTGGITVSTGNIAVTLGKISLGAGTNAAPIEKISKTFHSGAGTIPVINFSGTSATGGTGTVGYLIPPKATTAAIENISTPHLGSIVYDTTTNRLKVCTVSGLTGTWTVIGTQS